MLIGDAGSGLGWKPEWRGTFVSNFIFLWCILDTFPEGQTFPELQFFYLKTLIDLPESGVKWKLSDDWGCAPEEIPIFHFVQLLLIIFISLCSFSKGKIRNFSISLHAKSVIFSFSLIIFSRKMLIGDAGSGLGWKPEWRGTFVSNFIFLWCILDTFPEGQTFPELQFFYLKTLIDLPESGVIWKLSEDWGCAPKEILIFHFVQLLLIIFISLCSLPKGIFQSVCSFL